jgi:sulfonate transport system ATP-binding protein
MSEVPAALAATVRLQGVGKDFTGASGERVAALHDIDLSLEAGEIVALVGQSGCGKSTLLRLIAGLEAPSAGKVWVGSQAVSGPNLQCGMVFQEHRLLPWLNVADNIAFGLRRGSRQERSLIVAERIASSGLRGFERAYPHQLSGGMAQRAALARALASGPAVLLLDEPFGALDALTKTRMQEELLRTREGSKPTTVLVTHDIEEAVFLADSVIVLSERPGTLRRAFALDLARPRDRLSGAFSRFRGSVLYELGCPFESSAPRRSATHVNGGLAPASRTKEVS